MPLTLAGTGTESTVRTIKGEEKIRRFLESLGFTAGSRVTVVSQTGGNLIVNVKDTRVAISSSMANKILV